MTGHFNDTNLQINQIDKAELLINQMVIYEMNGCRKSISSKKIVLAKVLTIKENDYNEEALERMNNHFSTKDWLNVVMHEMGKSERTAYGWLSDMKKSNIIKTTGYGSIEKVLTVMDYE